MKQNPLYVPVELNVLLLGKSETERPLRDVFPKYDRLGENGLFGDDITNDNPVFRWGKPGAHLHWLMPDALLRGCQREDGEMEFPELPNRWIVIRLSSEGDHIRRKAWIIQSDKLSPPGERQTENGMEKSAAPCLLYDEKDGIWKPAGENGAYFTYLGDEAVYGSETEPRSRLDRLTAVGTGDHLFAAMYPLCSTVFGFYDPLSEACAGRYTYLVCGYYSDSASDPFSGGSPEKTGEEYEWIWDETGISPDSILCHGAVYGVEWEGEDHRYIISDREKMDVAVGNTSAEALSVYLQGIFPDIRGMERILNALQCGILEEFDNTDLTDNTVTLENKLHARQFAVSAAGRGLNRISLENEECGEEIYLLWHRYMKYQSSPFGKEGAKKIRESLESALEVYEKGKQTEKELAGELEREQQEAEQDCIPEQPYYSPNPPVLLLADMSAKRTYRHGFQKDETGQLPCRMRTVESLEITLEEGISGAVAADDLEAVFRDDSGTLPEVVRRLCAETVLLDGDSAASLAEIFLRNAGIQDESRYIDEASAKIKEVQRSIADGPYAAALKSWRQPWNPLMLEWKVAVKPARTSVDPDDSLEYFHLGEIDLEPGDTEPEGGEVTLQGQVLLTPNAPFVFGNMLTKLAQCYGTGSPEYEEILKFAAEMNDRQILSQQLAGFNEALRGLRWVPAVPVMTDSADEEEKRLAARVCRAVTDIYPVGVIDGSAERYLPFRGGKMQILELALIDEFGQYRKIELPDRIAVGEGFRSGEDDTGNPVLPPRLPGGARIRFDWICDESSREKENRAAGAADPGVSPVCGFVLADTLDCSLQIYDPFGCFLGWLQRTDENVRWRCRPGSQMKPDEIPYPALSDFVSFMLGAEIQEYLKLLEYIDSFFSEKPLPQERQGAISLSGGCLALVRAEISVEEKGEHKRYWGDDMHGTNGYENAGFSMKLGDRRLGRDGVAVFFTGSGNAPGYNCMLPGGAEVQGLTLEHSKVQVSFLLDPYRQVTVRTGFLPVYQEQLAEELYRPQTENNIRLFLEMWPVLLPEEKGYFPVTEIAGKKLRTVCDTGKGTTVVCDIEKKLSDISVGSGMEIRELYLFMEEKEEDEDETEDRSQPV